MHSENSVSNKPYKVHHVGGSNPWSVVEEPTGLVIDYCDSSREAKLFANMLNGGNGFRGWTPPFLLEQLKVLNV